MTRRRDCWELRRFREKVRKGEARHQTNLGSDGRVGRRGFLVAALTLGAAAATRGIACAAAAPSPAPPPESGLSYEGLLKGEAGFQPRRPIALPHPEILGFLSHDQLAQNYRAYRHDFERLMVAERVLATMPRDFAHGNDYGLIRRQQIEAANSVLLHEFYFRNLAQKPMKPSSYILDNLNEHMGSFASWRADFIECARIAPTWAILEYDPYDDRWHNLPAGDGDAGGWAGGNPLVVCDVASHAYLLNYAERAKYLERFIEHVDWDVVAARYRAVDRH
jgi:superoxide dismutase